MTQAIIASELSDDDLYDLLETIAVAHWEHSNTGLPLPRIRAMVSIDGKLHLSDGIIPPPEGTPFAIITTHDAPAILN